MVSEADARIDKKHSVEASLLIRVLHEFTVLPMWWYFQPESFSLYFFDSFLDGSLNRKLFKVVYLNVLLDPFL
jgi:hypothetical protein